MNEVAKEAPRKCTGEHSIYWYPETNEAGWRCSWCGFKPGEPPGFDPGRDRERIFEKVDAICHDLHDAKIVYFSNGDHGHGVASSVAERCRKEGRFDQYSIALFILEGMADRRSRYWKEISDGIVAGKDPRRRCACGALATVYGGGSPPRCGECWDKSDETW